MHRPESSHHLGEARPRGTRGDLQGGEPLTRRDSCRHPQGKGRRPREAAEALGRASRGHQEHVGEDRRRGHESELGRPAEDLRRLAEAPRDRPRPAAPFGGRHTGQDGPRHPRRACQLHPRFRDREERPRRHPEGRGEHGAAAREPEAAGKQVEARAREDRMRDDEERVVRPGPQEEVQPGERIEDLVVGVGPERLPETDPGVPQRPFAPRHGADERRHLRVPHEPHVALEEDAAGDHGVAEQEGREEDEGERDGGGFERTAKGGPARRGGSRDRPSVRRPPGSAHGPGGAVRAFRSHAASTSAAVGIVARRPSVCSSTAST